MSLERDTYIYFYGGGGGKGWLKNGREREKLESWLSSLYVVCVYMCAQVLLIGAKRLSIIDFSHQQGSGKQAACSILFTNKKKKVLFRFPGALNPKSIKPIRLK